MGHDRQEEMCPVLFFGYMQSRTIFVIVIDDASSCFFLAPSVSYDVCIYFMCVCVCEKSGVSIFGVP